MTQLDTMRIAMIWAMAENRVIGRDGELPWHLPDEMRHFVAMTRGKPIIAGRRTFESFGKPLPKRTNIVVSTQPDYTPTGALKAASLDEALSLARNDLDAREVRDAELREAVIVGGAVLYEAALPRADRLYQTIIHGKPAGDTLFPEFDTSAFEQIQSTFHPADDRHEYAFTLLTLSRKPLD